MTRLLLSVSPLALLAALGFHALTLVSAEAADCTIDSTSPDLTETNGGECAVDGFEFGDVLTLGEGVSLGDEEAKLNGITGLAAIADGVNVIINGNIHVDAKTNASPFDDPPTGAFGVLVHGDNGSIQNNGMVTIDPQDTSPQELGLGEGNPPRLNFAIYYNGNYGTIKNYGTVVNKSRNGQGLRVRGDYGLNENYGYVETHGVNGFGMMISGDFGKMINYGRIKTTARHGRGMYFNTIPDDDPEQRPPLEGGIAINFGTIEATGFRQTTGMWSQQINSRLENHGSIHILGEYTRGMATNYAGSTMLNTGSILVEGGGSSGARASGFGSTVINYGSIVSTGYKSSLGELGGGLANEGDGALDEFGDSAILENHGYIKAKVDGLLSSGKGRRLVVNSGYVESFMGPDDPDFEGYHYSINLEYEGTSTELEDSSFELSLLRDSVLVGDVAMNHPEIVTMNFGAGLNAAVRVDPDGIIGESAVKNADDFEAMLTVNSANGIHVVRDYVLYSADLTDYVAQDAVMGELTRSVQSVVSSRLFSRQAQIEEASAETSVGQICESQWYAPFGGYAKSDGGDAYDGYRGWTSGLATGCPLEGGMNAFGGLAYSSAEPKDGENYSIQSFGAFAGVQGDLPDMDMSYAVTLGYANQTHERRVADNRDKDDGIVDHLDDYASLYLTPSLAIKLPDLGLGEFDLQLSYTGIWYSEHDFGADLSIDESFSNAVSVQLAHSIALENGNILSFGGGASWQQREDTGLTLAGESFDIEDPRDADEAIMGQAFFSMSAPTGLWTRVAATLGQDDQFGVSVNAGMQF